MAIEKINQEKCIGCGKCAKVCLADVIRFDSAKRKAYVKYPGECMVCLWCVYECSAKAIILTDGKLKPMFRSW